VDVAVIAPRPERVEQAVKATVGQAEVEAQERISLRQGLVEPVETALPYFGGRDSDEMGCYLS